MTKLLRVAVAAAILLGSAGAARALTLVSPPLSAPSGGFFDCAIFNHSPSKTMIAAITILDDQGDEVNSSDVICNGTGHRICFRTAADTAARARALVCRFDVTGIGRGDARAAVRVFDATFQQTTALEAR